MAKKQTNQPEAVFTTITPRNGSILFQGKTYLPGEAFACPEPEAYRLIDMGAAVTVASVLEPSVIVAASQTDDLQKAIAAAQSLEELQALAPQEKPADEVVEAFTARVAELSAPDSADDTGEQGQ